MAQSYLAVIQPGLESILLEELKTHKIKNPKQIVGGVEFTCTRTQFLPLLLSNRTATKIYQELDAFRCRDRFELFKKIKRMDWSSWFPFPSFFRLEVVSSESSLNGKGEIETVVKDGIHQHYKEKGFTASSSSDAPAFHLLVRLQNNEASIKWNVSGTPLYHRGWREEQGEAPLRENIAFCLLQAMGWTAGVPLVDPFCGSGTFLIEAARFAEHRLPRIHEEYDLLLTLLINQAQWEESKQQPHLMVKKPLLLWGYDYSAQNIDYAKNNAYRAEVENSIVFEKQAVIYSKPPTNEKGMLIGNPPYGRRLSGKWKNDSPAIDTVLMRFEEHWQGWKMGLLLPRPFTFSSPRLFAKEILHFQNGGYPVSFWIFEHKKGKENS